MMQLLLFAFSAIVLFLGHFFTWFIITSWAPNSPLFIVATAFIIIFLFFSILLSSFLIHRHDNFFNRSYYLLASVWTGVMGNFILSFLFFYIIKFFIPVLFTDSLLFPSLVVLFTGAISIYGLCNAYYHKIKEYEVKIKGLSPYWHNKYIVQISDVHLGPIYRKKSLLRAINKINKLKPEAVFITGDLFDGMESDFSWLHLPFSKLDTKKGIYYSFGNHDLYLGFDRVSKLLAKSPVKILDNKMKTVEGLQLIGINYSFNKDFDLYRAILDQVGYDKMKPSILLYHEPKNIKLAKSAGINLQMSGHTHNGQMFPFNLLASLVYKGHSHGLHKSGNFSLLVNTGLGTWGPPMRTAGHSEISRIKLLPL
ncbi:MAG TPA: metallophosphoesterase [Patescibacteria group bacterium]|nr:metallophosphoesterase [Patescibacteria group bacterium]